MKNLLTVRPIASLAAAALLFGSASLVPAHASPGRETVSIGMGAVGQHAIESVGMIDQNGGDFSSYGYITYIRGLPDSVLFSDPVVHSEATARFTYYAPGKLIARSVLGTLFELSSVGALTFYANASGGASFKTPTSFQRGTPIAKLTTRQQSIVNVQAPNQGILTLMGDTSQTSAQSFTLLGGTYSLGRVGLQEAMVVTGQGVRLDKTAPRATFNVAGAFVVAGNAGS